VEKEPPHIKWLVDTSVRLETADGKEIEVWEFRHQNDNVVLSEWATHLRNHYCLDSDIDTLISGTGKTKKQYLLDIKFPDEKKGLGPSVRSADFSEIMIADYLEYICNYWVPRLRYIDKTIKNESTKGSDVIGFKITQSDIFSSDDEMMIFEVKAALVKEFENRLQDAVDDSTIDEVRKGESLNALKQKLLEKKKETYKYVERFQNKTDHPYIEKSGAATVLEKSIFDKTDFTATITSNHYNRDGLSLIAVKGENMMALVHALYRRAADEA
jgi:hypothetical protein